MGIAGMVILAALVCLACGGGVESYNLGKEANLLSLKIGELPRIVEPTDTGSFAIPEPISSFDWEDEGFDLKGADITSVPLAKETDTQNVRLYPQVSKGARVEWGIGSQDTRPFVFKDRRVNATCEDADVLYFRVTSEDGETTQYYRFLIWVRSPVTDLVNVYIGKYATHTVTSATGSPSTVVDIDERMMAELGPPNPTLDAAIANTSLGVLAIKLDQAAGAEIVGTKYDGHATLKFGIAATSTETPVLEASNPGALTIIGFNVPDHPDVVFPVPNTEGSHPLNLVDYTYLYIEVTAENGVDKAYYKFRIEVDRIATISSLTFVGAANAKYGVADTGTARGSWNSVANGKFSTAEMPAEGFGIEYVKNDDRATVEWALIAIKSAGLPSTFTSPAKVVFNGNNVLAIRVTSGNGLTTRYYKIEVTLLAAAFTLQPLSAYYYNYNPALKVGDPAGYYVDWFEYAKKNFPAGYTLPPTDPLYKSDADVVALTATLDRNISNGEYQWYEANSWYGGYGFDADGRILYYEAGNATAKPEPGFTGGDANNASTYYVNGFDEKKNVSLHNGGNQFYRLENPGRKITGASGTFSGDTVPAYKPTIEDKRPFIDGYTSESHYYWVEITDKDTGRKAVSKRAVIVTERDVRKKHHIVKLTDDANGDLYLGPKANPTEKGYARNPNVFKVKRETYKIPVTFPVGFNVKDYTIATVQALFFLIDGTPWIQNWTQGDIGFEAEDGTQLIYYNLTNNNGTLGLVGGGKEPGGGSLLKTPKYLIVKPAGEKPISEMPPLNADLTPKPNNDAQGWFCGFIELVEVRFEGPAR